ncbi:unnamed protein product [Soboliphyme baturini]|uniref:Regulator of ribonuclease activity homolog n=1 Tax=Soboliphyme baturini TaxID=241478 RepID=A0A183J2W8_9BILA|nr:unnamed protein product [Soboliphyme baturini]
MTYDKICEVVKELDPTEQHLLIHCGDMDVKVFPKAGKSDEVFTKGNGIRLFAKEMRSENVYTVWVTTDENLQQKVKALCEGHANKNYAFVSSPEILLAAMASATIREIQLRPVNERILSREFSRDYS